MKDENGKPFGVRLVVCGNSKMGQLIFNENNEFRSGAFFNRTEAIAVIEVYVNAGWISQEDKSRLVEHINESPLLDLEEFRADREKQKEKSNDGTQSVH